MLGLNAEGAPVTNGVQNQWTRGKLVPIHMAPDASRRMVSYAHAQLGAASWRMPRVTNVPDLRGLGRGAFRRRLTLKRQRRILRLLADGATVRQVAKATRTNFTVIAHVRKAALAWKDPDDE
jgi:DNA-binding NarL/FixJ family response regulator